MSYPNAGESADVIWNQIRKTPNVINLGRRQKKVMRKFVSHAPVVLANYLNDRADVTTIYSARADFLSFLLEEHYIDEIVQTMPWWQKLIAVKIMKQTLAKITELGIMKLHDDCATARTRRNPYQSVEAYIGHDSQLMERMHLPVLRTYLTGDMTIGELLVAQPEIILFPDTVQTIGTISLKIGK